MAQNGEIWEKLRKFGEKRRKTVCQTLVNEKAKFWF
jgi:hypothetical protein